MSKVVDQLKTALRSEGYSLTAPRLMVFNSLVGKEPLPMAQIIANCVEVDRASVYRTIGLFETLGIVDRLQIGWKYKLELSDNFRQHHHHLTCLICGRILPFNEDADLEAKLAKIASDNNFQITSHQLEISGKCLVCTRYEKGPGSILPGPAGSLTLPLPA